MIPVLIEPTANGFRAIVAGYPSLSAQAPSKEEAVTELQSDLDKKSASGELVWIHSPRTMSSIFRTSPPTQEEIEATEEMLAEIYRERDALKRAEFPE